MPWVNLFGIFCVSRTWKSISFFGFRKFSAIISSKPFLIPFCLFAFWNVYYVYVGTNILSYGSRMLLSKICFLSVLIGWFPLSYLPDYVCILCVIYSVFYCFWSGFFFLISGIELSSFDWVVFIVSSSLLKWCTFTLTLFLNSVSIFITSFLTWVSGRLVMFHYLFFQGFSFAFNWK